MKSHYLVTACLLVSAMPVSVHAEPAPDEEQVEQESVEAVVEIEAEAEDGEPMNLAGFMASLFGEEPMTEEELQAAVEAASAFPLGSEENPVRADGPPGQRAYLSRLRCQNLKRPKFDRLGSAGMSPYGGIVDIYKVECEDSESAESHVFMDMYHAGHVEEEAVPGFGIDGGRRAK